MNIRWAHSAQADLHQILDYYDEIDPTLADRLIERIEDAPTRLRDHPRAGENVALGLRKWRVRKTPFILLYRIRDDHVEIARVVHAAQDWPAP